MINIRFLYFFVVFTVFLEGCSCPKLNISQSERQWVVHFKVGDRSIYRNATGNTDTLIVTVINNYYMDCNRLEQSEYQNEIYLVTFKLKSKSSYNEVEPFMTVTAEGWKKRIPYIHFGNLGPRKINSENPDPKLLDTVINGLSFDFVCHYYRDLNTEQYGENEYFRDFFWSRDLGLLAYTTAEGDFFLKLESDK